MNDSGGTIRGLEVRGYNEFAVKAADFQSADRQPIIFRRLSADC